MVSYIFMDESGDLGFNFSKPKTSKYFVISFLFTSDKKPLENIVKKVFKTFTPTEIKHHTGNLHAYKEKPKVRLLLLKLLSQKDIVIMSIYLNKKKVYSKLQDEKQILYNYVTNILMDRLFTKKLLSKKDDIQLIASRRETNKFLNQNFCDYLEKQLKDNHNAKIKILIRSPQNEKALQVIDFVSWATFRKYEFLDESYWNIIKNKIVEENALFH